MTTDGSGELKTNETTDFIISTSKATKIGYQMSKATEIGYHVLLTWRKNVQNILLAIIFQKLLWHYLEKEK